MQSETGNSAQKLWKNQQVESVQISLAEVRITAQKFEKRIHRRNLREYLGGAIGIACFGYYIWKFPDPILRFGCVLVIAGGLFVMYQLRRRGAARVVPAETAFRDCLNFHRKELERQRDLLRSIWTWYLLPLVPGLAVFVLGLFRLALKQSNAPAHSHLVMTKFGLAAAGYTLVFIAIGKLNQRAARKLQYKIDALDSLEKEC